MRASLLCVVVIPLLFLAGCSSNPPRDSLAGTDFSNVQISGDFAGSPEAKRFIQRMARQHGFNPTETAAVISRAQRKQSIIDLMNQQAPSKSTGPNGARTR